MASIKDVGKGVMDETTWSGEWTRGQLGWFYIDASLWCGWAEDMMRVSLIFFSCVRIADLPYALLTNPLLLKLSPLNVQASVSDPSLSSLASLLGPFSPLSNFWCYLKLKTHITHHPPLLFCPQTPISSSRLLPLSHSNQSSWSGFWLCSLQSQTFKNATASLLSSLQSFLHPSSCCLNCNHLLSTFFKEDIFWTASTMQEMLSPFTDEKQWTLNS